MTIFMSIEFILDECNNVNRENDRKWYNTEDM